MAASLAHSHCAAFDATLQVKGEVLSYGDGLHYCCLPVEQSRRSKLVRAGGEMFDGVMSFYYVYTTTLAPRRITSTNPLVSSGFCPHNVHYLYSMECC